MSMNWGPAADAEINYRQQQTRNDFGRRVFHRKAHTDRVSSPRHPNRPATQREV